MSDNKLKTTIIKEKKIWDWHYKPRDINLDQAVEEFTELFERINANEIEKRQERIAKKNKFKITSHSMQLYGTCETCQE